MTSLDQLQVNRFMPRFPCLENGITLLVTRHQLFMPVCFQTLPSLPMEEVMWPKFPPGHRKTSKGLPWGRSLGETIFQEVGSREGQRTMVDFRHRLYSSPITS